jgi:superfamily II DNA or RNA helicase
MENLNNSEEYKINTLLNNYDIDFITKKNYIDLKKNDKLYNDLTINNDKIEHNNNLKIKLKEHQKTSVSAMLKFENEGKVNFTVIGYMKNFELRLINYYHYYNDNKEEFKPYELEIETNFGILADKVGSGKTYMILGLLTESLTVTQRDRIISSGIFTAMKYKNNEKSLKTNLIIVPHNLILQWKTVFENTNLKTHCIVKNSDLNKLKYPFCDFIIDSDFDEIECVEYYDVIIISSTMFDNFYDKFRDLKWSRIIIDEVCSIKLPQHINWKCDFIWFLTATPSGIAYVRRNYIKSLVTGLNELLIENIIIKNKDEYVDASMELPPIKQIIVNCLTSKQFQIIKDYVPSEILSMLNAGNVQDAIVKLNCNTDTTDNILEIVTKKIQKELKNNKITLEAKEKIDPDDKKSHEESIKLLKDKIQSLEVKLDSITNRIKSFKEESCPICLDELSNPVILQCCNHIFCFQCIMMGNQLCPMCRSSIDMNKLNIIDDNKTITKNNNLRNKSDNLISILTKNKKGKFLLFSNYDQTFDNLIQMLNDNNITFSKVQGHPSAINNIINKFELGEIRVLMLNAQNYGSGLNLQMATDIIIYHELSKELEIQVIGRAQRIGRINPLNVYYLLNDNEKVNCDKPNLTLDLFENDLSQLDKYLNTNIESNEIIIEKKEKKEKKDKSTSRKKITTTNI